MSVKERPTAMRSQPGGVQNTGFTISQISESEESLLLATEFKFIEAENNQKKQKADIKKKLIKVRHDIEVGKVYDYIINKWKLKQPKLIVSITDVPQNFRMKEWHTTFLKRLIKIAVDTGAWIVTGGTNYGVMKHVGKAVQEYTDRKSLKEAENVVVIGITAWGAIHDRQKILEEKQHDVRNPSAGGVLDKNHSHFILVDDGSEGQYGKETTFRNKFEEYLAKTKNGEKEILIKCILLQGGSGSLKTVYESVKAGTRVVVVGDSGQWESILATFTKQEGNQNRIKDLFPEFRTRGKNDEELKRMAEECAEKKHLITVIPIDILHTHNLCFKSLLLDSILSKEFTFTDAEGRKEQKIKKLIKVRPDIEVAEVYDYIMTEWKLKPPKLIISVTGGARVFRKKLWHTRFIKHLIHIAVDTGAWIITGGTNYGVMAEVGKAVEEYCSKTKKETGKVVTLGITTWGAIHERKKILEEMQHDVSNPKGVLDKNHSHFIMVDDGSEGKYGKEITFRANFEKHIAKKKDNGKEILKCCILLQGGSGSLKTANEALKAGTPVVVVGGSGQWANILATLCSSQEEAQVNQNRIKDLLQENMMKWNTNEELSSWTFMAEECVKKKHLITVFQLDTLDSAEEQDANMQQNEEIDETVHGRIASANSNTKQKVLENIFVETIKNDNAKLVKYLLDDPHFKPKLKWDVLMDLYKTICVSSNLWKQILEKKSVLNWADVTSVMQMLLGLSYEEHKYKPKVDTLKEIFQWSVLMNRKELARVIWESMTDHRLPAAVAATAMLKKMAKMSSATTLRDSLNEHAKDYASITQHILTQCTKDDPKKTKKLLTRKHRTWGGLDCLQMAVDASDRDMVANPAVQNYLTSLWRNNMKYSGWIHLLLAVAFIFPLFWIDFSETVEVAVGESLEAGNAGSGNKRKVSMPKKFLAFYQAPVTKYIIDIMYHLLFLILFSYILLFNFHPYTGSFLTLEAPSLSEWLLVLWALILSLDEIYAVLGQNNQKLLQSVRFWFADHWNKMDTLALLLFLLGFVLRFHSDLNPSRLILSLSFIVYCLRLLQVITLGETIGPKIVIIGYMLKDLWFFVVIVAIFLFAYGVTSQGMLYPNETRIWSGIKGIFYKPYWQIYGELFLDEINYDPASSSFECTNNQTLLNAGYQRCPQQQDAVAVISAFYMLLANILLLNLLIAMFSYTFTKVEGNVAIWRFHQYQLIEEYRTRPPLPAPFSVIWYLLKSFELILCDPCTTNKRGADKAEKRELDKFEKQITDIYLEKAKDIPNLSTRKQDRDVLKGDSSERQVSAIDDRVKKLEANLGQVSESLQWIMQAMQDNNTVPQNLIQNVHVKALTSPYPQSNVDRFPVPGILVSWTIPMASYQPKFYTAEAVAKSPFRADPPLEGTTDNPRPQFNAYDSHYKVDRRSYMGKYPIVNNLPRNPIGRTGIWGRGLLGRYGPNYAANPIVTRWVKGDDGNDLEIEGKRVLEFIAIKLKGTGDWAIPGGMVHPGETITETLLRKFEEEVKCENPDMESEDLKKKLKTFLESNVAIEVFRGYADDHRNTDNSWIESVAMNFHDDSDEVLGNLVLSPGVDAKGAQWKRIEKSLELFASHRDCIEKVAGMRKAYF